jgi:hypothetical protein
LLLSACALPGDVAACRATSARNRVVRLFRLAA